MPRSRVICPVIGLVVLTLCCHPALATGVDFVVLIVDQLSVSDVIYTELPSIRRLCQEGAVGLMNTATAGTTSPENAAVTIGAGARALGPVASAQSFDADTQIVAIPTLSQGSEVFVLASTDSEQFTTNPPETAQLVYERRTGRQLTGRIVNLSIAEIAAANKALTHRPVPGALGSLLSKAGVRVSYFGNADTDQPRRHMTVIFMDEWGVIPEGSVRTPVIRDPWSPFGIRSDYEYLSEIILDRIPDSSGTNRVIAIEIGDLARLYQARHSYTDQSVIEMRNRVLERLDTLIGVLLKKLSAEDRLMLLVPTPPQHDIAAGNSFAPLVLWCGDGSMRGALTSDTTRRVGLVTNLDVAPTILAAFGVDPPETFGGAAVESVAVSNVEDLLATTLKRTVATGIQRRTILHPIVSAYIATYIIALLYVILRPDAAWVRITLLKALLLMASMPLALLLLPLFGLTGSIASLSAAVLLALAMALVAQSSTRNPVLHIALVSLSTALALIVDTCTGTRLIQNSVLGYDPMGGARFYGIGNEYMGVLVGSTIMGTTALLDVLPRSETWLRSLFVVLYAGVLLILVLPMVGANVGGGITAAVSLPITALLIYRGRLTKRRLLFALALPVLVVGGATVIDLYFNPEGPTHLGRAVQLIDANGIYEAFAIIRRKLQMNLKLFRYSVWSRALVIALIAIAWLLYRPTPLIQRIKQAFPRTVSGLTGTTIAAIVALLVNDSGVVAGALVLHYAAVAILYLSVRLTPRRREVLSNSNQ